MSRPDLPIPLAARVLEYCRALGTGWTYALHRNPYAVAGFLWGLRPRPSWTRPGAARPTSWP